MELLTSLKNQLSNRWIINQARLRSIHRALLCCLENTAPLIGREDYHPGEINLSQWFDFSPFSIILRLIVSRNGIDVFTKKSPFPEFKIIRQFSGRYLLLDGLEYEVTGRMIHENSRYLPQILTSLSAIHFHQSQGQDNIGISRIS